MNYQGGRAVWVVLLAAALAGAFLLALPPAQADSLDELERKRQDLSQDLDKYQSAAQNKEKEARDLNTQIKRLTSDIESTERKVVETDGKIGEKQSTIQGLAGEITQKQKEMEVLKRHLNLAIVEIYRFSARSEWELLFGQASLGEAANQQKYIEAVEMQVKLLYNKVSSIKADLEKRKKEEEAAKAELDQLKQQQLAYKSSAEWQKGQKDKVLGMTVEQKKKYDEMVQKIKGEVANISQEIYHKRQEMLGRGRETLGGGASGYSYSCWQVDPWYFWTCQCTSYAAWYWNVKLGKSWTNTRPGSGSAWNWPTMAGDQGYSVSATPRAGAIISWSAGPLTSGYGHVAIVEGVNGDGTINLSEYNWIPLSYSYRRNVNPGDYGSYSYIY